MRQISPGILRLGYRIIYIVMVAIGITAIIHRLTFSEVPHFSFDSLHYLADYDNLDAGIPGLWRTPLYCLFAGSLLSVSPVWAGGLGIMLLQLSGQLLATMLFARTARKMMPRNRVTVLLATGFMGLCPYTLFYFLYLLPESFIMSLNVVMLTVILRFMRRPSVNNAVAWGALLLLLLALKPVYIYMLPITGAVMAWVGRRRVWRPAAVAGLCSTFVLACIVGVYSQWMERHHGFRGLTLATEVNKCYLLRDLEPQIAGEIENPGLRREYETRIIPCRDDWRLWDAAIDILEKYPAEFTAELDRAIISHPAEVARVFVERIPEFGNDSMFLYTFWEYYHWYRIQQLVPIKLYWLYLIIPGFLMLMFFAPSSLGRDRATWTTVWIIVAMHFGLSYCGGMWEWGRLMSPVWPMVFLIAAKLCAVVTGAIQHRLNAGKSMMI